ncbi:MAG: RelA/SpoT family protein [Bacteroidota bacterium]|nr:RelA/SpoT family protein [Bacteroidota bacterium]
MAKKTLNKEELEAKRQLEDIIKHCPRCKAPEDKRLIRKAFTLATEAHKGVRRRSGELYIMHPLAVARIVAEEIGLGTKGIIAALLHDVVEDTDVSLEDIQTIFGEKIANIVDGLTKLEGVIDHTGSRQAENFRKLLLTMVDDVRIILIKLADRLHNMRTLDSMPDHKKYKIAGETLFIYAPLAHRLGLYAIKSELEDLSLKYEHPAVYDEISQKLQDYCSKNDAVLRRFSLPIIEKLTEDGYEFDIKGRPKSIFSIWSKMQKKSIPFEEIYDLLALRIVFKPKPGVPEKTQCWSIYSLITDIYKPKPDRLRDWVSIPKANGYEALHATFMGPDGKWVEIQIRSERMDEIAERGFAAHWKYKGQTDRESELDNWLKQVREILENPDLDSMEFLDDFKLNLFSSEMMIFTPKGDVKVLPKGATALDLAFEIHTNIGYKCIGAKVNYKLVPLSHELKSGDQVEILTSEKQTPKYEWLNYVTTAKAKSCIKEAFKKERRMLVQQGEAMLQEALSQKKLTINAKILKKLIDFYNLPSKEDLYYKISKNAIRLMSSQGDRIVSASWESHKILSFLAQINVSGIDQIGIVSKITKVISDDQNVNMRSIHFDSHDGIFEGYIYLYIHNTEDLNNIILNISKIKGVHSVTRQERIRNVVS